MGLSFHDEDSMEASAQNLRFNSNPNLPTTSDSIVDEERDDDSDNEFNYDSDIQAVKKDII